MSRLRRYGLALLGLCCLAGLIAAAGSWRYRVSRPEYRLRQGQEALQRGDLAEAETLVEHLEAAGYPVHAHVLRGQCYLRRGELERAILEYNQIPHEQRELLAEASLIYGLGFLSLGYSAQAEKMLLYVVEVDPDNIDARRGLATLAYDRGSMVEALGHLTKWSELDDLDGQPHRFMGVIYKDQMALVPAAEHYRKALQRRLSPRVREAAVIEWVEVLIQQTEYAEALA